MDELERLLRSVPDCYEDFVIGVLAEARHYSDKKDDLAAYIKDNPNATSSDIGMWTTINMQGIDLDNPPELVLVDDDDEE